ncbi:MAG TPA: tetratricopeptide repeat protein [Trueperaceae bacterium]|nr:tetratricopeptide repeat protein [Trueperaceae bacterium]
MMLIINKPLAKKTKYLGLLILLLTIIIAFLLQLDKEKETSYFVYPFALSSQNKALSKLESEISFYKLRSQANPDDGLELASLAALYLKKARISGWASWYLLAEQSAKHSLANLAFNNKGALLVLAKTAEARHDFNRAINLAEQVLKQQTGNKTALAILISSNLGKGNLEIADQYAKQLMGQFPSASSLGFEALIKQARGDIDSARHDYKQAISYEEVGENYSSAWLRSKLGVLEFKAGNYDLAQKLYLEALKIVPKYPLAILNLAALELEQEDYQKAIDHYQAILTQTENSATVFDHQALQGLARANYLIGKTKLAEQIWGQAEDVLRNDVNNSVFGHKRELASLLLERGHPEDSAEAEQLLSQEIDNRHDSKTLNLYAFALMRLKKYDKAKTILMKAINTGTKDAAIYYRMAELEQALGNTSQAKAYYQQAENINPLFNIEQWQKLYF